MNKRIKTAFWLLAALAFVQIFWWGFLITHQQDTLAQMIDTPEALSKAVSYKLMILAEGLFFLLVWCFGVYTALRYYQRELNLQEAQKDFFSAITHELKTPIATARLCLDTLERKDLSDSQKDMYVARAQTALNKLLEEIEGLLAMSQSSQDIAFETTSFNAHDLIQEIVSESPRQELVKTSPALENLKMKAPVPQLRLIVRSVLENALKYHENPQNAQVFVDGTCSENTSEICIRDNGIGLTPEEKDNLLISFYRSPRAKNISPSGTGLGLSLARRLAERSNIEMHFESEGPGQGTAVRIRWGQQVAR